MEITVILGTVLLVLALCPVILAWRLGRKLRRLLETSREGAVPLGQTAEFVFDGPGPRHVYLEQPIGTAYANVSGLRILGPDGRPVRAMLSSHHVGPFVTRPVTTSFSHARICVGTAHPNVPGRHLVTSWGDPHGPFHLVFFRPYVGSMVALILGLVACGIAFMLALAFGSLLTSGQLG